MTPSPDTPFGCRVGGVTNEADSWWDMFKSTHDVPHMGWTQFEELLLAKYFPEAMRRQKRLKFVHL